MTMIGQTARRLHGARSLNGRRMSRSLNDIHVSVFMSAWNGSSISLAVRLDIVDRFGSQSGRAVETFWQSLRAVTGT